MVLSHRKKTMSLAVQVLASSDSSKSDAGASDAGGGGKQSTGLLPQPQNPSVLLPAVRGVAAMIAAEQATAGPLRRQYQVREPTHLAVVIVPGDPTPSWPNTHRPGSSRPVEHHLDTYAQPPSQHHTIG